MTATTNPEAPFDLNIRPLRDLLNMGLNPQQFKALMQHRLDLIPLGREKKANLAKTLEGMYKPKAA